jgi:lantibiotic modifying enzyme
LGAFFIKIVYYLCSPQVADKNLLVMSINSVEQNYLYVGIAGKIAYLSKGKTKQQIKNIKSRVLKCRPQKHVHIPATKFFRHGVV